MSDGQSVNEKVEEKGEWREMLCGKFEELFGSAEVKGLHRVRGCPLAFRSTRRRVGSPEKIKKRELCVSRLCQRRGVVYPSVSTRTLHRGRSANLYRRSYFGARASAQSKSYFAFEKSFRRYRHSIAARYFISIH